MWTEGSLVCGLIILVASDISFGPWNHGTGRVGNVPGARAGFTGRGNFEVFTYYLPGSGF